MIHVHRAKNPNVRFWGNYYRSRSEPFNAYDLADARALLSAAGFDEIEVFAAGLTDARKYLPLLRHRAGFDRIFHSGAEPDLDYRLSNLPGLFRLASHWFFVASKA